MAKKLILSTLFIFLFCFVSLAQDIKQQGETLEFYPNPVLNGKIYIISKNTLDKEIVLFDVLGKKILQTRVSNRELNIPNIPPGVYIIKISDSESTSTRKLIVR